MIDYYIGNTQVMRIDEERLETKDVDYKFVSSLNGLVLIGVPVYQDVLKLIKSHSLRVRDYGEIVSRFDYIITDYNDIVAFRDNYIATTDQGFLSKVAQLNYLVLKVSNIDIVHAIMNMSMLSFFRPEKFRGQFEVFFRDEKIYSLKRGKFYVHASEPLPEYEIIFTARLLSSVFSPQKKYREEIDKNELHYEFIIDGEPVRIVGDYFNVSEESKKKVPRIITEIFAKYIGWRVKCSSSYTEEDFILGRGDDIIASVEDSMTSMIISNIKRSDPELRKLVEDIDAVTKAIISGLG